MIEEFFGIRILHTEIHMFKSLMARYYKPTYQKLLKKILSGNLLHVDETEVRLQTGKGYVWAFTNLEEVVFMFKPTREGGFLRELMNGFHGVLVSDFYSAYDSIECPQQKCLIHLMRDINQELLNNPFDEELQLITRPFGGLLRTIITTIDEHGLKTKRLKKHKGAVENFFRSLSEQSIRSEVAEALRARLIKYQDKLFTFINHDSVPWNNNNAEHAIKQFAYYRENMNGMLTEAGMSDYLLLLSICQTCHYKGVSFLKFLLSRVGTGRVHAGRITRKDQGPSNARRIFPMQEPRANRRRARAQNRNRDGRQIAFESAAKRSPFRKIRACARPCIAWLCDPRSRIGIALACVSLRSCMRARSCRGDSPSPIG
jgi:hypothetical protein